MAASTPIQITPASEPLNQDTEAQLEKSADDDNKSSVEMPLFFKIAISLFLVALIALPAIFLLGVVFILTGVMRSDGTIILNEDDDRPIVKALAGCWLAVWLGADMLAKVLLLGLVVGAFITYFSS